MKKDLWEDPLKGQPDMSELANINRELKRLKALVSYAAPHHHLARNRLAPRWGRGHGHHHLFNWPVANIE